MTGSEEHCTKRPIEAFVSRQDTKGQRFLFTSCQNKRDITSSQLCREGPNFRKFEGICRGFNFRVNFGQKI